MENSDFQSNFKPSYPFFTIKLKIIVLGVGCFKAFVRLYPTEPVVKDGQNFPVFHYSPFDTPVLIKSFFSNQLLEFVKDTLVEGNFEMLVVTSWCHGVMVSWYHGVNSLITSLKRQNYDVRHQICVIHIIHIPDKWCILSACTKASHPRWTYTLPNPKIPNHNILTMCAISWGVRSVLPF